MISIHNVMGTDIFQVNPLLFKELQGFVDVLQAVDPHATTRGPRLGENREIYYYDTKILIIKVLCAASCNINIL